MDDDGGHTATKNDTDFIKSLIDFVNEKWFEHENYHKEVSSVRYNRFKGNFSST